MASTSPTITRKEGSVSISYPSGGIWKYGGQTISYYDVPGTAYEIKTIGSAPAYDPRTGTLISGGQGYSVSPDKAEAVAGQAVRPSADPQKPQLQSYLNPMQDQQGMSIRQDQPQQQQPKTYTAGLWSMKKTYADQPARSAEEKAMGQAAAGFFEPFTKAPEMIPKMAKERNVNLLEAGAAYALESFVISPVKWATEDVPSQPWSITAAQIIPMAATFGIMKGFKVAKSGSTDIGVSFGASDVFVRDNLGRGMTYDVTATAGKNIWKGRTDSLMKSNEMTSKQTEVKGIHVTELTSKSGKNLKATTATKDISFKTSEFTANGYGIGKSIAEGQKPSNLAYRDFSYKLGSIEYDTPQSKAIGDRTATYTSVSRFKSVGISMSDQPRLKLATAGITDVYKLAEKPATSSGGGLMLKQAYEPKGFVNSIVKSQPATATRISSQVRTELAKTSPAEKVLSLRVSPNQEQKGAAQYALKSMPLKQEEKMDSKYASAITQGQRMDMAYLVGSKQKPMQFQKPKVNQRIANMPASATSLGMVQSQRLQFKQASRLDMKPLSLSRMSLARGTLKPPSFFTRAPKETLPLPTFSQAKIPKPNVKSRRFSPGALGFTGIRAGLSDLTASAGLKSIRPSAGFFSFRRRRRR
jgi:hypothetical protein